MEARGAPYVTSTAPGWDKPHHPFVTPGIVTCPGIVVYTWTYWHGNGVLHIVPHLFFQAPALWPVVAVALRLRLLREEERDHQEEVSEVEGVLKGSGFG